MKKKIFYSFLVIMSLLFVAFGIQKQSYAQESFKSPFNQVGPVSMPTLGKVSAQPTDNPDNLPDVPSKKEDGKTVLQVETKVTDDEVSDLKAKTYKPEDSLIKPVIAASTMNPETDSSTQTSSSKSLLLGLGRLFGGRVNAATVQQASSNPNSDITIPQAAISVQDGTSSFDSDNNPGHDNSATNGIVRSWDSVTYLVAFSIQNTSLETNYTNIRYRVTSDLSNAITVMADGKTPQVNATIVNGTTYNADGTVYSGGAGYSEGIMESTISNTGQVFVPISVSVQGAPNGLSLQPIFKLQIVDATNKDTGETVTFNNEYTTTDFSALTPTAVKVSATPSVGVQLVRGQQLVGQAAANVLSDSGGANTTLEAWDVGAVEILNPLSGRAANDYRGSTYPTTAVSFTIKSKGSYVPFNDTATAMPQNDTYSYEASIQAYSVATLGRNGTWIRPTTGFQQGGPINPQYITDALDSPNGNTGKVYVNFPPAGINLTSIGTYQSGNFSVTQSGGAGLANTSTVTNTSFTGINNPYTYNMTGSQRTGSYAFASSEYICRYDNSRVKSVGTNKWSSYTISLYVDSVTYDGTTNSNNSQVDYTTNLAPSGGYDSSVSIMSGTKVPYASRVINGYNMVDYDIEPLNLSGSGTIDGDGGGAMQSFGDVLLTGNQKIYAYDRQSWSSLKGGNNTIDGTYSLLQWDPTAFSLDTSRGFRTRFLQSSVWTYTKNNIYYGVPLSSAASAVAPVSKKSIGYDKTVAQYTWYTSYSAVPDPAKIAAIRAEQAWTSKENLDWGFQIFGVPLVVSNNVKGATTPAGNSLIITAASKIDLTNHPSGGIPGPIFDPIINDPTTKIVNNTGKLGDVGAYIPSTFNADGSVNNKNGTINGTVTTQKYWSAVGESAFVKPYSINTQTYTSLDGNNWLGTGAQYEVNAPIQVKIRGLLTGSSSSIYNGQVKTTLPPGIVYTSGSAKDAKGNPLPEPTITTTGSGNTLQQVLSWSFNTMSLVSGVEVDFLTSSQLGIIFNNPSFNNNGSTKSSLQINTVGSMWVNGQTAGIDTTGAIASARSSYALFNEQLIQQLILSKTTDKAAIEVGNIDPANSNSSTSNDITYTVTAMNNSAQIVNNLGLLDVLPYSGDSRGSKFHGGYTVVNAKATLTNSDGSAGTAPTLSFSTTAPSSSGINEKTDANTSIKGTIVSSGVDYSKATMFQVSNPTPVGVGATVTLTITIRPNNGQQAGDVYVNTAGMDSSIVQPVFSQPVKTTVYGRDLSGMAWVDKDKDGLYEKGEQLVSNIPVKLYRTSLVNKGYSNQVVTKDMDGSSFVDTSGNSTVLTKSDGSYLFGNLPEGSYVAEFKIDGLIHKQNFMVTAINVGKDVSINSKTDPKTYRTDSYMAQALTLTDLPRTVGTDKVIHMQYLNLGVTPPPDTLLPYTGANNMMQIGLMIASSLTLGGLIVFAGKYYWLERKKKRSDFD